MINVRYQTNNVQVYMCWGFVLFLLIITANIDEAKAMSKVIKNIELAPVNIKGVEDIQNIRLFETTEGILAFTSATGKLSTATNHPLIISKNIIAPGFVQQNTMLTINQLLAVHSAWDVNVTTNQSYAFVAEFAGGAINQLFYYNQDSQGTPFTDKYPFNSFSNPRFSRGGREGSQAEVSAILDNEKLVVFPNLTNTKNSHFIEIGEWDSGVLLHAKQSYTVIAKRLHSGESRHDVMPGVIELLELDSQFKPKGAVISPVLANTVYEYDADILFINDKSKYIIFSTGEDKPLLGVYDSNSNVYSEIMLSGQFDKENLTRPSILVTTTHVYIAVIEARLTKNARVLMGSLRLN